jgi:multiple sugar transport system permease protein
MKVRRALASDNVTGWALAGPAVFLIFVFGVIPIIWAFLLSFEKSNLINPSTPWVGLGNYRALARDPLLKQAAAHTLFYTAVFVPLSVFGGLLVAIALNRKIRGIRWYRTAVFVPVVASTIAAAIMFLDSSAGGIARPLEVLQVAPLALSLGLPEAVSRHPEQA